MTKASMKPERGKSLLDKYRSLAIVMALLLIGFSSLAQVRTGVRQYVNSKGYINKEGQYDSALIVPRDTLRLLAKDSGALAWKGGRPWVFNGFKWDTLEGGAGGGKVYHPGQGIIIENDSIKVDSASLPRDTTTFYKISAQVAGTGTIGFPLGIIGVQAYATAAALRLAPVNISTTYWRNIGGDIRPYRYDALDSTTTDDGVMVLAAPDGKRYKMLYTDVGGVDPYWWDAVPNDIIDDTGPTQACVNFALNSGVIKKVVFRHIGQYLIDNLVLAKYVSGQSTQFSLTIDAAMNSTSLGVSLKSTNLDGAIIHIQHAAGVVINNIVFQGRGPQVANYILAEDAEWTAATGGGTIRSNRKSPGQTAISIDNLYAPGAFNSTLSGTGDEYPGMTSWYSNTNYNGSTNIILNDCAFKNLFVGVAEGLSGAPNGEGIHVIHPYIESVAYFYVSGQLQSRENSIERAYAIFGHTFVTNSGWGTGIGDIPLVTSCNVNYQKYLFQTDGNFTFPRFSQGYSEGLWSLGKHTGSTPVVIDKWNLTIGNNDVSGAGFTGMAPVLAETAGPLSILNTNILGGNYYNGMPFNCQQVIFNNSRIEGGLPFNTNIGTYTDNIKFINTHYFEGGGNIRLDEVRNNVALDDAIYINRNESFILPGGKLTTPDKRVFENVGEKFDKIYLGGLGVTVNVPAQTLTFTAPTAGVLRVNDIIYTSTLIDYTGDVYSSSGTTLGFVSAIVGSTVTLSNIPAGITNGAGYDMYIIRLPRWVNHTLGTVASGTNSITGVVADPGTFIAGDRIKGAGIPAGAYVTNVSGSTITISTNATASGTNVELYDAKMKVTGTNADFSYLGGTYNYETLGRIWFKGDEIFNVNGFGTRSKYCIYPGKATTANLPQWYEGFETLSLGTDQQILFNNLHYDGTNTVYNNSTNPASQLQLAYGDLYFQTAPTGTANSIAALPVKLRITNAGLGQVGGLWSYTGNFNGGMTSLSIPNVKYVDSLHGIWKNLQVANTRAAGYTGVNVARTDSLGMAASSANFGATNEIWSEKRLDINVGSGQDLQITANQIKYQGGLTMLALPGTPTSGATQFSSNPYNMHVNLWGGTAPISRYSSFQAVPTATARVYRTLFKVNSTNGSDGATAFDIDTLGQVGMIHVKSAPSTVAPLPTIAVGAGAGTGATAIIQFGSDLGFTVQLNPGTSPGAAGTLLATVTWGTPFTAGTFPVVGFAPVGTNGALTAALGLYFVPLATTMEIRAANVPTSGVSYQFCITTIGQ